MFPGSESEIWTFRYSEEYTIYLICSFPLVFPYILVRFFLYSSMLSAGLKVNEESFGLVWAGVVKRQRQEPGRVTQEGVKQSSRRRKPRRGKLSQLLADLKLPWCSHCSNLARGMVASYPGRQDEEGSSGPNTGHGRHQETCLPQSPHTRQTGPCTCQLAV